MKFMRSQLDRRSLRSLKPAHLKRAVEAVISESLERRLLPRDLHVPNPVRQLPQRRVDAGQSGSILLADLHAPGPPGSPLQASVRGRPTPTVAGLGRELARQLHAELMPRDGRTGRLRMYREIVTLSVERDNDRQGAQA